MTPEVPKELDALRKMLRNWKKRWLREYTPEGPNEWIMEEICGLIFGDDTYCYGYFSSYLKRLLECDYLTKDEYKNFWGEVYDELDDMREQLHLPDPKQKITTLSK